MIRKYLIFTLISCVVGQEWLGPFIKEDEVNPVLTPVNTTSFWCPVLQQEVNWESKDVFNPAALVWQNKIHLLYRAEDTIGPFAGTSRVGLATSTDGLHFTRFTEPIFYPANDSALTYEWPGGCEDPRIVQTSSGTFYMTYTAFDGKTARLMVASSDDLFNWVKHGPVFGGEYIDLWSKSGAIVTEMLGTDDQNIVAVPIKINGSYWMYWGDTNIYLATSTDLIHWSPFMDTDGQTIYKVFGPRPGKFDSGLVEPGPQALRSSEGILLIYNSRNNPENQGGDPNLPEGTYSAGQILFNPEEPYKVIRRTDEYFMTPDKEYEMTGQVNNVVFLEGLVFYKGKAFIYYGTADSKIAVASMAMSNFSYKIKKN